MPWPATHIVISEILHSKAFSHLNEKEFIVGGVFPDIRYFGVIEKEKTHDKSIKLSEVKNEPDSFFAGYKLHSFLDVFEQHFWDDTGIYKWGPKSPYINYAIRYIEDSVFCKKIKDSHKLSSYFNDVLDQELSFGIDVEYIQKWHKLQQMNLSEEMNLEKLAKGMQVLDFPEDSQKGVIELAKEFEKNRKLYDLAEQFYKKVNELI